MRALKKSDILYKLKIGLPCFSESTYNLTAVSVKKYPASNYRKEKDFWRLGLTISAVKMMTILESLVTITRRRSIF